MAELLQEVERRLTEIKSIIAITRNVNREDNWEEISVLMDLAEDLAQRTREKVSCTIVDELNITNWKTSV